jgi:hypothetical protein
MRSSFIIAFLTVLACAGSVLAQPTSFVLIGSNTQVAGTSQNLTIRADSLGLRAQSYTGVKKLVFSGAGPSPSPVTNPTVTDLSGTAVNFGDTVQIQFLNGLAVVSGGANGRLQLYRAAVENVAVTDGTLGSSPLTVTVSPGTLSKFSLALGSAQQNSVAFTGTNRLTALDSWGNTVTTFNPSTDPVTVTPNTLSGSVSGLGSTNTNVLDRAGDFASGVADLTGKLTYTGLIGTGTFTARSASTHEGTSATVSIVAGPATKVRVETLPTGAGIVVPASSLASGDSITVYAITRDISDNFVANVAASSWVLNGKTGGVVDGDLVPASDSKSAKFRAKKVGTAQIGALSGALGSISSGTITVNAGPGSQVVVETLPDGSGQAYGPDTLVSGDSVTVYSISRDAAGNFIANVPATWSLTNETGDVTDADLVVSGDARSARFRAGLAGSATIVATAAPLGSITGGPVTVEAGPATKFVITGSTSQLAGAANNLTITARDAAGNVATTHTGNHNLIFSGADSSANPKTAPTVRDRTGTDWAFGVSTSINFANGVASVSSGNNGRMTLYHASRDSIGATEGSIRTTGGDKLVVTVSPATHTKFQFVLSTPQTNGTPFAGTNTLTAQDAWGNTISGFSAASDPVSVASTLSGTISGLGSGNNNVLNQSSDFVSGVANLSGELTFTGTAGTGTFTASATGKTGTSNSVSIVSGGATRLVITGSGTQVAGASQNIVITARDGSGNTVTSYAGAKTLTFSGSAISPDSSKKPTIADSNGVARDFGLPTGLRFVGGVATVSGSSNGVMALYAAGASTITATDGAISSSGSDRLSVAVSPAAFGKFSLALATPQVNGVTFTGTNTLTAQDLYGNTITAYNAATNNVTLTSTLSGTITGLGSGNNNVLNQSGDFVSGVANLTGRLRYTGATGSGTFTARSADNKTGVSGTVLIQTGAATRLVITGASTQVAGTTQNLTITAKDSSGNTVTSYAGDKSLTFAGGDSSLSPSQPATITDKNGVARPFGAATTIVFVNGVGSASAGSNGAMRLLRSGSQTISVTDGTLSSTGSDRLVVTVSAGPIGKYAVVLSSPQTSEVAFSGTNTITALDDYGNTLTTFNAATNNVAVTASAAGTISGLGSGNNNVLNQSGDFLGGVANLTGKMRFTGTADTVRFTATGSGKTGQSGVVTIQPGAARRLVLTGSGTMNAGASQNLTITARDSAGNTVTGYTGVKSLTFSGSGPSPSPPKSPVVLNNAGDSIAFGTPTSILFTNGVARVSAGTNGVMVLYRAGVDTIVVSDGLILSRGADRLTVNVQPGPLGRFLVSISNPQTNRVPFSGTNTITAVDQFGNAVVGFNAAADNVTMTASLSGKVSGLGSLQNNVLDRIIDFSGGVANIAGVDNHIRYEGAGGKSVFFVSSGTGRSGVSDSVTINNLAPTLSQVSPDSASRSESVTVTLTGTNFYQGVTTVDFGAGITVDSITVTSSSTLLARITISPTAALGLRSVSVRNGPPGGGTATKTGAFRVQNLPKLFSLNPSSGVRGQTVNVVMTGTNFSTGVSTVSITGPAGVTLNSTQVISSTQIVANITVSLSATDGVRQFFVTNADPGGGKSEGLAFTVGSNPAPQITSVSPDSGARTNAYELTIRGQNFFSGLTSVYLGPGVALGTLTVDSTSQLRLVVTVADSAATGPRDIVVTNAPPGGGTATLTSGFRVVNPRPTIASVVPQSASRLQTRDVTITGTNYFKDATSVYFGPGLNVDSVRVLSLTQISAKVRVDSSATIGPHDVIVLNAIPGGGADTLRGGFTVNNPTSVLSSISPESLPVGSPATEMTLIGTGFVSESVARLDLRSLATTYVSTTQLKATIPSSELDSAKVFAVTVLNPGGAPSNAQTFTVGNPVPTLVLVSPDSLYRLQSVGMVFTGSGFIQGVTTVAFNPANDIQVKSVVVTSPTSLTANIAVGAGAAIGQRAVTVSNPTPGGGTSGARTFVIVGNPVPTLASVLPATLSRLQTATVVLTGTNFIEGVSVPSFGPNITVNTLKVDSASQMTASVSVGAGASTGSRTVTVTNAAPAGGVSNTRSIQVNNPVPVLLSISPSNGEQLQTYAVTLTGRNFITGVTSLNMGVGITVNSLTVENDTLISASIRIETTAGTGPRDVIVSNLPPGGGSGVLTNGYVVGVNPIPTLSSISPGAATRLQTLSIIFRGSNFLGGVTSVDFGPGIVVNSTTVDSSTRLTANITVLASAATGPRTALLSNRPPGGGTDSLPGALTVSNPAPVLTQISPNRGTLQQTLDVTFRGRYFMQGVTTVLMGQAITTNTVTVVTDSQLVANVTITSAATLGQRSVSASNPVPGGGISGGQIFTVETSTVGIPTPLLPLEGTTNLLTTVNLAWSQVSDAVSYHLQVATDPTFVMIAFVDSQVVGTSRIVGPLQPLTKYYWRVRARLLSQDGPFSSPATFTTGQGYPTSFTLSSVVSFPTKTNPGDYVARDYRIVGLPGASDLPLQDLVGGVHTVDWQAYWDNGDADASRGMIPYDASVTFRFSTGRAFWLVRKGDLSISRSVPSAPLDTNGNVTMPLHSGWNLIANPFPSPIAWAAVLAANGLSAGEPIYAYEGAWSQPGTFNAYAGYYYFNATNLPSLKVPYRATGAAAKPVATEGWLMRVAMEMGDFREEIVSLGVAENARRELDFMDHRRPRSPGDVPAAYFARPEWDPAYPVFVSDIRPVFATLESWDLDVDAPGKASVKLTFTGVGEVPAEFQVKLLDRERAVAVDLREKPEYAFSPARPTSRFSLLVGSPEAVSAEIAQSLPKEFALGDNYPNPFNPTTTIPVAVPVQSEVTLKVYSLLGEEVRTLHAGPLQPGRYWFTWDARNDRGATVATGVYLSRLTGGAGKSITKKMILMK